MKRRSARVALCGLAAGSALAISQPAQAVDFEDVGGETLTIDITNTSELGYHFDNRNTESVLDDPGSHLDDKYGEWLNRLHLNVFYWKLSMGLQLDSAAYFNTFNREDARQRIQDELGRADLALENRFAQDLHSRYTSLLYPARLSLGFKHKRLEITAGDFYAQLGRGLVFSVRKIDEVATDTTVRGGKIELGTKFDNFRLEGTVFGGQLNPNRVDRPTGRILHGTGSPLFFAFPRASDFEFYSSDAPDNFYHHSCTDPNADEPCDRAKPSYLEDNVVGGNLTLGPKQVQFGANAAALLRQSNSSELERCKSLAAGTDEEISRIEAQCLVDFPTFSTTETTRLHDQLINFSGTINVPPIADTINGYLEVAGQHQRKGRVNTINADGSLARDDNRWGYGIYANIGLTIGDVVATLEGKHYRKFFPLAANIDETTLGFSAPELKTTSYSQPPNAEAIYTEPIGSPDVCNTGGRGRVDATLMEGLSVFGWLGRSTSFSEKDPSNDSCATDDGFRTDTWDTAGGGEVELQKRKTLHKAWVGARFTDVGEAVPSLGGASAVFYREGYLRYDLIQHLSGAFSLTAQGHHRRRYEPLGILTDVWHEGENYLALNWNPHWSFIFGYEYTTDDNHPPHYFNGSIQYRSRDIETWYGQLTDMVRIYAGQSRAALRCVGGSCRWFPAVEGAKIELVSRF